MSMTSFDNHKATAAGRRLPRAVEYYLGHFLIYLGCMTVILVIGWLALKANRIYASYQAATQQLSRLESVIIENAAGDSEADLGAMQAAVQELTTSLDRLYMEITPFLPLLPYLDWLPVYGEDLQALPHLLGISRSLSRAVELLSGAFSPALAGRYEQQGAILPQIVANLAAVRADLAEIERLLRQSQAALGQLDLNYLSPSIAAQVKPLRAYLPQVISGLVLIEEMPALLGADSPQTYLVLTQNVDELRPAGGYINAAGHLTVAQGRVTEFVMQDSYAVDRLSEAYPYPPAPLYQYMAAEYWVLRDAAWSPDFPEAAHTAIELYELGQGVRASGVIALDQYGLAYLLRALEPLQVDGEQVTGGNVIRLMHQHWAPEPGGEFSQAWWSQRKSFMLSLAETIKQRFEESPETVKLSILADALKQALDEKHLLVYLQDPTSNALLADQNWNGAIPPAQGDYIMVADANVGFNKASAQVERKLRYQVTLADDGSTHNQISLVYHHHARRRSETCSIELRYDPIYEQNMERCYWNYHQVIVPATARLSSSPGIVVDGRFLLRAQSTSGEIDRATYSANRLGWGQLFLLAPQEEIRLDYSYELPAGTAYAVAEQWVYHLYLQKQPGTLAPAVEVVVRLPEGARFLESSRQPAVLDGRTLTYRLKMMTDQQLEILYSLSE